LHATIAADQRLSQCPGDDCNGADHERHGTLLPILRDSGELSTRFGKLVVGAGAVGELGPVLIVSLILTHEHTSWQQTLLLLSFAGVALIADRCGNGVDPAVPIARACAAPVLRRGATRPYRP